MHMGTAGEEAMHACVYAWEAAEMPEMLYHAHALGVQHMHLGYSICTWGGEGTMCMCVSRERSEG